MLGLRIWLMRRTMCRLFGHKWRQLGCLKTDVCARCLEMRWRQL